MAITGSITLNDVLILEVDSNPSTGTAAPIGSLATDKVAGKLYKKDGALDTNWTELGNSGAAIVDATALVKGIIQLAGDLSGTAASPAVSTVGGSTASNINAATVLSNNATSSNTVLTIVRRDASGNFAAGAITASSIISSVNVGGTTPTSTLISKATSGVGTAGADQIFQVGNNGATEAMRILNSGNIGIGTPTPSFLLDVAGKLRSNQYILGQGPDLSLIPVINGQSVISSWHTLQLAGSRQNAVDYTPTDAGGSTNPCSVIIPNQQAAQIGLIVQGIAAQTADIFRIQNSAFTSLMTVTASGSVGIGTTSPTALLHVNGSHSIKSTTVTANYTASNESIILANAATGAITITLPAASTCLDRVYVIKKIDTTRNSVIIDGNASELIDGLNIQTINAPYTSINIVCNGTAWYIY